jgi:hypothetical protein
VGLLCGIPANHNCKFGSAIGPTLMQIEFCKQYP